MKVTPRAQIRVRGEHGISLVGLVFVVAIVGVMAAVAVQTLDQDRMADPGAAPASSTSIQAEASAGRPVTAIRAAAIAACLANVAALQRAAAAATVTTGHGPESLDDLMRHGFIHDFQPPAGYRYELRPAADGGAPRVVVNGIPGDEGCRNGPTQG